MEDRKSPFKMNGLFLLSVMDVLQFSIPKGRRDSLKNKILLRSCFDCFTQTEWFS